MNFIVDCFADSSFTCRSSLFLVFVCQRGKGRGDLEIQVGHILEPFLKVGQKGKPKG